MRKLIIGLVVLILLAGVGWLLLQRFNPEMSIDVSQDELQKRLVEKFPVKNCSMLVACIELDRPKITLVEGSDRIGFAASLVLMFGERQFPGQVALNGKVRYARDEGEFFLDEIAIDQFEIAGLPTEFADFVRKRGPSVLGAVLASRPVYSLKGDSTKTALAKLALRDVKVANGLLRITFGAPIR
jgi:Protein of unknown function (DUF1439)